MRIAESGGYRARFPRSEECEAVLINTGGGMAGGDRLAIDISLAAGAEAVVTTQAAEKIYRAQDLPTTISVSLDIGPESRLAWLPQETILFDGAAVERQLSVDMAGRASLTLAETVFFGRSAMGESLASGTFRDRWSIRRDGRLIWEERVSLARDIAATLARPAVGQGARAVATVLHITPDAEARLEDARALLETAGSECGASAWDGLLVLRFLAQDAAVLRRDLVRFLEGFRMRPMPRSW
ncbi:urease accessory protein UreD [Chelatococcus sp. GCM10030263]|uniref:urease accessory protein UreD n=1 Tax=Chelatococcus sp. GCM10030263 TaxID=3273387 RepID=UPI0036238DF2